MFDYSGYREVERDNEVYGTCDRGITVPKQENCTHLTESLCLYGFGLLIFLMVQSSTNTLHHLERLIQVKSVLKTITHTLYLRIVCCAF